MTFALALWHVMGGRKATRPAYNGGYIYMNTRGIVAFYPNDGGYPEEYNFVIRASSYHATDWEVVP